MTTFLTSNINVNIERLFEKSAYILIFSHKRYPRNVSARVIIISQVLSLQGTEELFKKEANLTDISADDTQQTDSEVNSVLSAYKSEGDPALYEKAYSELKKFVEGSLDIYKVDYFKFENSYKVQM